MHTPPVMGVDIGGSHITTSLVDINKGTPVTSTAVRLELNSRGAAHEILFTCAEAITKSYPAVAGSDIAIGIAMPGPFDYEHGISLIHDQDKFRSLYKHDVKSELAARLSVHPSQIHFMNDACAFLEGEILGGAVKGETEVMGITLGTGLGSAFSKDGEVVDADLWHTPYRDGIAEDYLSTRWFVARYEQLTGTRLHGVREMTLEQQAPAAVATVFNEFAENLGGFIHEQYKTHGYKTIVVGGNIAKAASLFAPQLDRYLQSNASGAAYRFSKLGETASLTGAAGMAARKVNANRRAQSKA